MKYKLQIKNISIDVDIKRKKIIFNISSKEELEFEYKFDVFDVDVSLFEKFDGQIINKISNIKNGVFEIEYKERKVMDGTYEDGYFIEVDEDYIFNELHKIIGININNEYFIYGNLFLNNELFDLYNFFKIEKNY